MYKGALRRSTKVSPNALQGFFYSRDEFGGGYGPLEQHTEEVSAKAEASILKEGEEQLYEINKAKQDKENAEKLRQAKEEEEKRLRTPQELTMETAPGDIILEPPKKKKKEDEPVPTYVQIKPPIAESKIYYTQIID